MQLVKILGATLLATGLAAPVLAQGMVDAAALTCSELLAMDEIGLMAAGTAINALPKAAGAAAMSDAEASAAAGEACRANPGMNVTDALMSAM